MAQEVATASAQPAGRRGRFGVGSLLVLVTLIGIACAALIRGGVERRNAAAELRAAGAKLSFDPRRLSLLRKVRGAILGADAADNLYQVALRDAVVGDEIFAPLGQFPEVQSLGLEKTHVTDRGFASLPPLRNLRYLMLTDVQISDAAAALHRYGCPELFHLNLGGTNITDVGVAEVAQMPRLTDLHLNATKVTDAAIKNLAPLLKLNDLGLRGTAVTSAGLDARTQFTNLEHLSALPHGRR